MLPEDELDTIDEILMQKTQPTEIANTTLLRSEQAAAEIPWYKKIEQQTEGSGRTQSTDDFTTKFSSGKDPAITFNIDNATAPKALHNENEEERIQLQIMLLDINRCPIRAQRGPLELNRRYSTAQIT
jgi:hypothetical protein